MDYGLLVTVQDTVGYDFRDIGLLNQALFPSQKNTILIRIGESALNTVTTRILCQRFCKLKSVDASYDYRNPRNEYELIIGEQTYLRFFEKLCGNSYLSARVDCLGFSKFINGKLIDKNATADLFKAIVGAVVLDCGWDFEILYDVVDIMLYPDFVINQTVNVFYDRVLCWTSKEFNANPQYRYLDTSEIKSYTPYKSFTMPREIQKSWRYVCIMRLGEYETEFRGFGETRIEARKNAYEVAYDHLKDKGLLPGPSTAIGKPDRAYARSQLRELYRKAYIAKPLFDSFAITSSRGKGVWRCSCHITDDSRIWWGDFDSRREGEAKVAYDMLCDLLKDN
ncbi:MAG: hypothetical protein IJP16_02340 [Clostridia bacterium]|nr:hypothetical protein [Clostridia bacterium]